MIASKVICDDTYSNKSWTIVGQGMFNLREVNQMEREMCSYLDWELTVDNVLLRDFEAWVRRDFASAEGPFPTYSLTSVSKRAARAATSTSATPLPEPSHSSSPIPVFATGSRHPSPASSESSPQQRRKRTKVYADSPPQNTPSPSYSMSSPASSASPTTPTGPNDWSARIHGVDEPMGFALVRTSKATHTSHPLKPKMFSVASLTSW